VPKVLINGLSRKTEVISSYLGDILRVSLNMLKDVAPDLLAPYTYLYHPKVP
jgi:hypothetical protein